VLTDARGLDAVFPQPACETVEECARRCPAPVARRCARRWIRANQQLATLAVANWAGEHGQIRARHARFFPGRFHFVVQEYNIRLDRSDVQRRLFRNRAGLDRRAGAMASTKEGRIAREYAKYAKRGEPVIRNQNQ